MHSCRLRSLIYFIISHDCWHTCKKIALANFEPVCRGCEFLMRFHYAFCWCKWNYGSCWARISQLKSWFALSHLCKRVGIIKAGRTGAFVNSMDALEQLFLIRCMCTSYDSWLYSYRPSHFAKGTERRELLRPFGITIAFSYRCANDLAFVFVGTK